MTHQVSTTARWLVLCLLLLGIVAGALRLSASQGRHLDLLHLRAWLGNESAMYSLGVAYESGKGKQRDLAKAAYWIQRAANSGSLEARLVLTLTKPVDVRIRELRQLEAEGSAEAALTLGTYYFYGYMVLRDLTAAAAHFRSAHRLGDRSASRWLVACLMEAGQLAEAASVVSEVREQRRGTDNAFENVARELEVRHASEAN